VTNQVNRKDIQGIVASGYDHLSHVRYVFLKIVNAGKARIWLSEITPFITNAQYPETHKPPACFNFAVSWKGLKELGVAGLLLDYPHEFERGMNTNEACRILGDTGDSHSNKWEYGGEDNREDGKPLHLLLLLYGKTHDDLQTLYKNVCGKYQTVGVANGSNGLEIIKEENSVREQDNYNEPFGFRDGISQPPVKGLIGRRQQPVECPLNTGEFVIGYENEINFVARGPSIENWADPHGLLHDHPSYAGKRRLFGMNGTYLVFRKLQQDVAGFWEFVDKESKDISCVDPARSRDLLAAKMMGRWPSGSPLVLAPDSPGSEPRNDFLFMDTDPDGEGCPVGSHIRRANPRDSLDMPPARSILISRRHRIIRRGRKYKEEKKDPTGKLNCEQGIFFIALNADLRHQFEFVQRIWINAPTFNGLDDDRDPIAGGNDGSSSFTVQAKPISDHLHGLERFVTTKGGGYFFVPGIRAVRFLANYHP
jgi:Dyp-type peroxidase family